MKRWAWLIVFVIAGTASVASTRAGGETEPTLVLAELFTSEGCSSCPPADHLLETLLKEQPINGVYVVALSEHVTYWDHQGWRDPFGSNQLTNRQTSYGRGFNIESIYTPQLIIDGVSQLVGSDAPRIEKALTDAGRVPKPKITVAATWKDGEISMTASGPGVEAIGAAGAELWWAVAEDDLVVDVKRGENASRTLHHSGVVRLLRSSDVAKGAGRAAMTLPFKSEAKREHLRVVAFAQSRKTRQVISIGWTRVKED
ncbi:MAG: DUF1223 domain-containing protein [Vicinamibacterales bacterium]|jgi:hypothetical protein